MGFQCIYSLTNLDIKKAQEALLKLSRMMRYVLYENQKEWNKTVNMVFDDPIPILKVIEFMESSIGLDARKNIINKGSNYIISNDTFKKYKSKIFPTLKDEKYSERVFKKHLRLKLNN